MRVLPILLALLLLAGALAPGTAVSQADDELTLRVAMQDDIRGTNPFVTDDDHWTILATQWLYDTPMFSGPNGLMPYIAIGSANVSGKADSWDDCVIGNFGYSPKTSWADSGKKEAIIFYDFENVKWHNGTQMDIRDVMFSYHAMAQNPYWRGDVDCLMGDNYSEDNWLHIEKVWESGNKAALRFTLQTPYWQFFNLTLAVKLLPEHVWAYKISGQNVDGAKIWCDAGYNQTATDSWQISLAQRYENPNPVGSGPLMWKNWTRGQHIDISTWRGHFFKPGYRYEEYCLDDEGEPLAVQPHIDGIHYTIYKTAEAAVWALNNDDIDYIAWNIPPTFIQDLANAPGIALQQSPNPDFTFVGYNMWKSSFGYKDGDPVKGDSGAAFRKAVAHCIDKNRIVTRLILLGVGGEGPVSSISPWFNKTIPRYPFDPAEAKQILANAGYQVKRASDGVFLTDQTAIDAAGDGNWWHNPDGTPIGSSAGGLIEILSPESNYDPIRAQAGLMIAQQLRDVGIYAESMYDWGWGMDRIENRDFDICLLPAHINSGPAEFMYDMFHSDNAVVGINHAGYRNSSFDYIMDTARSTDNGTVRKNAVLEAQASICYDLPYDVLYYRTNIEAYRSDRIRGWAVDSSGTIFNIRSIRLITGPNPYKLSAQFVSSPSAVLSNSTTPITILVKDGAGVPIESAQVLLNASMGSMEEEIGYTDPTGKFTALYTAPYASPTDQYAVANGNEAIIQIKTATYTDSTGCEYDSSPSRLTVVKVFPVDAPFISLTLSVNPDNIDPDMNYAGTLGFAIVNLHVTDQAGAPVAGAKVMLHAWPAIPTVSSEEQLTDADGRAVFTVTATDMPDNDNSVMEFVLVAIAVHPTNPNIQAENRVALCIVDVVPQTPPPPPPFPGFPTFEVAVTLIAILTAAGIYAVVRRRKKL